MKRDTITIFVSGAKSLKEHRTRLKVLSNDINGVPEMKFTGPNGRSIFLPAGGRYGGKNTIDRMKIGFYWTAMVMALRWKRAYSAVGKMPA